MKNSSKNRVFLLLTLLCYSPLAAQIRTIYSLREANAVLSDLDDNALVVFDVDDTLIIAVDKIRRRHPESTIKALTKTHFDDKVTDLAAWRNLDSIAWTIAKHRLIESESPAIISALQSKNIRVIALTAMHSGPYYAIEDMQKWRYNHLRDFGIDLGMNNSSEAMYFNDLPIGRVSYPGIYKGVFATARSCTKGQALSAFIKHMGRNPSDVLFFDDRMEHVITVDHEMESLGIHCIAFHYIGTELIEEPLDPIDQERAAFQYKYLIENHQWLSDQDAAELMSKK